MKQFNLEDLERKNSYKTPENFFEKVQSNVLESVRKENGTDAVRETKTVRLSNWWYAAAASLVLGAGLFLMKNAGEKITETETIAAVKTNETSSPKNLNEQDSPKSRPETAENHTAFANNIQTTEKKNNTANSGKVIYEVKANKAIAEGNVTRQEMESFIEEFSAEDVSMISKNADKDVYLDLFY